jgi:dihydrofolate synthase / folylpolyglutamate synthase
VSTRVSADRATEPPGAAYGRALAAIEARGRFGVHLGLARVRALLRLLGDPQREVRGALVAGTNGKGSVIALAGAALQAAGYRVGATPKPHLITYRERIMIDGRPIAPDAFAGLVDEVLPLAERVARRLGPPTEFELLTAMMFRHLALVRPDVALIEVGLGGRLDATHAWDGGVAVVTNVTLDHTDRLGTTIGAIAREKAAIIERGDVAVTGTTGDARDVVVRRCARLGVPLTIAEPARLLGSGRDGIEVELPGLGGTAVGLRGAHQAANVAVADALLDALDAAGIATVPAAARRRGYRVARWPGRLELLEVSAPDGTVHDVLLDGAHNPDGASALAVALDDLAPVLTGGRRTPPSPLTLVWASMRDHDAETVIAAVAGARAVAGSALPVTVVCTALALPRALPADRVAAIWRQAVPGATVHVAPDPDAALDRALAIAPGAVIVAGSLYLVGAARRRLVDDPVLRDPPPQAPVTP